jgi:hypothetical protein
MMAIKQHCFFCQRESFDSKVKLLFYRIKLRPLLSAQSSSRCRTSVTVRYHVVFGKTRREPINSNIERET